MNINFQDKKLPKENASYKCLPLIMLYSIVKVKKRYYFQTFLEECKYDIKRSEMENPINDDLNESSSDESDNESDKDF